MAALPTRIRQNVRDHVADETSPLGLKLAAVKGVLGYSVNLDPEWAMLWKSLQAYYPDNSLFVPGIAETMITWCDAFQTWLEGEENEEKVEKLLDELRTRPIIIDLMLGIVSFKATTTRWSSSKCVFVISLPSNALPLRQHTLSGFATDLLNLFTASPIMGAIASPESDDPDEWAVLDRKPEATATTHMPTRSSDVEDDLPTVSTIQRPEELTKKPPYWLVVRQEGSRKVVVQGSHGPSLAVLEEYLKRWCRGDTTRVDRPPIIHIKLQEAAFGLGLYNDTLTMEGQRLREISAMLILVFVENVLGYQPVPSSVSAGSVWEFRRTKGLQVN